MTERALGIIILLFLVWIYLGYIAADAAAAGAEEL